MAAEGIEFAVDWLVLILSIAVFFIFYRQSTKLSGGEGKRILILLTFFLGISMFTFLFGESLEILHFLTFNKLEITEEFEETAAIIGRIFQIIGLGVLFYISAIFSGFADELGKIRK